VSLPPRFSNFVLATRIHQSLSRICVNEVCLQILEKDVQKYIQNQKLLWFRIAFYIQLCFATSFTFSFRSKFSISGSDVFVQNLVSLFRSRFCSEAVFCSEAGFSFQKLVSEAHFTSSFQKHIMDKRISFQKLVSELVFDDTLRCLLQKFRRAWYSSEAFLYSSEAFLWFRNFFLFRSVFLFLYSEAFFVSLLRDTESEASSHVLSWAGLAQHLWIVSFYCLAGLLMSYPHLAQSEY
jgi:hypothetical protein